MTMRFQPIMVPRPSAIAAKSSTPRNITPEAGCKAIAAAFPRAEYLPLPGLGHVPHIEAPEQVNELISS